MSELNLHMAVVAAKRKQSHFKNVLPVYLLCIVYVFVVVSCGLIHFVKRPPPDKDKQSGGGCLLVFF